VPTKHHVVDSAGIRFNGVQRCQRLYGIEANLCAQALYNRLLTDYS
jgi:hypothetical protein